MKSKSLWKRFFGQPTEKKVRAQVAFQEQFDTKLQFRELEPRVVLAADAVYDAMNQTLTITVEDGDSVEIGREGMDNFLFVDGLTTSSGDGTFAAGKLTLDTTTLTSITITDTNTNNSATPSMVTFLESLADGTDLGLTTSFTTLDNVDNVSVDLGAEVRVDSLNFLSTGTNTDDATVDINGQIIGDVNVDATNTTSKSLAVTSTAMGSVTAPSFTINRDATAGSVDIDLELGTHDLDSLSQSSTSDEVSIALNDTDEIELGDIVASEMTVVAGGAIEDTAATHIEVSGTASFDATEITLNNSVAGHEFATLTLVTSAGDAKLNEADGFALDGTNSITGNLEMEAGGTISQAGGTLSVTGTTSVTVAENKHVTFDQANDFGGEISVTGETYYAGIVTINNASGDLTLGQIHTKALDVTSAGAILQGTGELDIALTTDLEAGGAIALETGTNQFVGTVSAKSVGFETSLADIDAIILGSITSGSLKVNAGGAISQAAVTKIHTGDVQLTAIGNDISLTGPTNDFTGSVDATGAEVTLRDSNAIELGEISASKLSVHVDAAIGQTAGEKVVVTGTTSLQAPGSFITLTNADNDFGGSVEAKGSYVRLTDTNGIELGELTATHLEIIAGGAITQTALTTAKVSGETSLVASGAAITLTNADNDFGGSVDASGTEISLTDTNAIELGEISASKLTVMAGDAISQITLEKLVVTGDTSLTATGFAITVANADNNFGGSVDAAGTEVTLTDTDAIELGEIAASKLTVVAGGAITQTVGEKIIVSGMGAATFTATGAITLENGANDFTGTVTASGGAVSLVDANAIELGNLTADSLSVVASAGNITQAAGTMLDIAGTTQAKVADTFDVILFNAGNDFTGAVSVLGITTLDMPATVKLQDVNGIVLGDIEASSLEVTAGGHVTQFAGSTLDIDTTTTIAVADGFDVTLFNSGNMLTGAVLVGGINVTDTPDDVQIQNGAALVLGDIDAASLNVQAETGTISQLAGTSLTVGTTTTARVANGFNVTLNNSGNDFTGAVSVQGITALDMPATVKLQDVNGIVLGNIDANVLEITAGGNVTQAGGTSLDIATTTELVVADGFNVTLFNSGNDFGGAVSIDGINALDVPNEVKLNDINAIVLGDIEATSLEVVAGGLISQLGGTALNVPTISLTSIDAVTLGDITATTLNVSAGGLVSQAAGTALEISGATEVMVDDAVSVTLFNAGNNFGGSVSVLGNLMGEVPAAVMIKDKNALILGDIAADSLTVMTQGDITQAAMTKLVIETTTDVTTPNGFNVTLLNDDNNFGGAVSVTGNLPADVLNVVSIHDVNELTLGNIRAGKLQVDAEGDIDQAGGTTIYTGDATITVADAKNVTLFNSGNDFIGEVSVTSPGVGNAAGSVQIRDDNTLQLGNVAAKSLEIEAKGSVTQAGAATIHVEEETTIRVGNLADVTLFNTGNDFEGAVSVSGISLADVPDSVKIQDSGALLLGDITANSLEIKAAGDVTQDSLTKLDIETTTKVTTADGAQVILFNEGNDFRGAVSAVGNAATDTLGHVQIRDDAAILGVALTLGDIRSDTLTIRAEGTVQQQLGTKLLIDDTTDVMVADAADVELFNSGNDFGGLVSVQGIDPLADTPGAVSIRDDVADGANISLMLGNIKATSLEIMAAGTITQPTDGSTKIIVTTGSTDLELTAKGDIDLQYSENDIFTDTGLGKDFTVTLGGMPSNLENFYLRNVSAGAIIPSGDLPTALAGGTMGNVTFDFPNSPAVDLPEIHINGELIVNLDGDLTQSGDISVGQNALFTSGTITLAATHDLIVTDNASFTADQRDIEVGVVSTANNAYARGTASGTDTAFGTITFSATGFDVTIAEGSPAGDATPGMNLAGDNVAQSLVLTSSKGIETDALSTLTVADLSSFYAQAGNLQLGNGTDEAVDLRILYAEVSGHISIHEQADTNGLTIVDGTTASGTLAIKTDGPIIQVNDFRTGVVLNDAITTNQALFDSGSGILLTSLDVNTLAASADGTPLFVTPGMPFDVATAGLSGSDGFGGFLTTDMIDADLPDENSDEFAAGARADSFVDGAGENYSLIVVNDGNLTIAKVADALGDIGDVNGLETNGASVGHAFLRTTNSGDLTFGAAGSSPIIVDLTNSGVITALASGKLSITDGFSLHSSKGAGGVGDLFAVVSKIVEFDDMNLPAPNTQYEIDDPASWGPAYVRITGTVDTYLLDTSTGFDSEAIYVLTQLGEAGEMDFVLVTDWRQSSMPPEPAVLDFENIVVIEFTDNIDTPTNIVFFYPWEFATTHASVNIQVSAYNSPQINLYENVDAPTPTNLNVVNDSFRMYFKTPIDNVPMMEAFVPPPVPFVAPTPMVIAQTIINSSIVEISGDARVATPIEGVTVVEVNPNDLDMTIGEEIKLDGEFMTLDAVKELIQRDERFRPGLYRISIVYPGVDQPQISYYEKQIRATPTDIFGKQDNPIQPKAEQLAAVEKRESQLSPEEVWAREYDKWFPAVLIERVNEEAAEGAADPRQGMLPSDDDILVDRVSMIDLNEIERLTDRMRAKRGAVRESLGSAVLGGTLLMAAAASRQREVDQQPQEHEEGKVLPDDAELNGNSRDRLRRRMRQWL